MNSPPAYQRIEFPAELASLGLLEGHISTLMEEQGIADETRHDIHVCVNEAAANAVDHGSQFRGERKIVLEYRFDPGRIVLLLSDSGGRTFDPGYFRELAIRRDWGIGGRGILLMHELMDEVSYFFVPGQRTTVMLVKELRPAPAQDKGKSE